MFFGRRRILFWTILFLVKTGCLPIKRVVVQCAYGSFWGFEKKALKRLSCGEARQPSGERVRQ